MFALLCRLRVCLWRLFSDGKKNDSVTVEEEKGRTSGGRSKRIDAKPGDFTGEVGLGDAGNPAGGSNDATVTVVGEALLLQLPLLVRGVLLGRRSGMPPSPRPSDQEALTHSAPTPVTHWFPSFPDL